MGVASPMNAHRQWIKQLALDSKTPLDLRGTHRLETCHTIYVFDDGVCVDVARRGDTDEVSAELTLIGMRLVGWLFEVEGRRRVLARWMPGARAVLWRRTSPAAPSRIAVTSQSSSLVACARDDDEELDTADYKPALTGLSSGSFARVF